MKQKASAVWQGSLKEGSGTLSTGSGALSAKPYSFKTRFEGEQGTNPEELIGAAHAGCFSMAFSNMLAEAGHVPKRVSTTARVHLERVDGKPTISRIELDTEGDVPGISKEMFHEIAEKAKAGCPVSRALGAVDITLEARLRA